MLRRILPDTVANCFFELPERRRNQVTELRFRMGCDITMGFPWGEELLSGSKQLIATEGLFRELINRATEFSPYALKGEEQGLYLPLGQGYRMGICGEAVIENGAMHGIRHISSGVIRIAREVPGVAVEGAKRCIREGYPESVLIISPPGGGKTTYLRDLVRQLSVWGWRVSVADERREIAGAYRGKPSLDVGPRTDVLSGCPRAEAIPLLLRVMNPQVIAVDEIVGEQELRAVYTAAFSGVAVLATAHGRGVSELRKKPQYRELLDAGVFTLGITLLGRGKAHIERLGEDAETGGSVFCGNGIHDVGLGCGAELAASTAGTLPGAIGAGIDAKRNGTAYARHCGVV